MTFHRQADPSLISAATWPRRSTHFPRLKPKGERVGGDGPASPDRLPYQEWRTMAIIEIEVCRVTGYRMYNVVEREIDMNPVRMGLVRIYGYPVYIVSGTSAMSSAWFDCPTSSFYSSVVHTATSQAPVSMLNHSCPFASIPT
jgi:hypothetical protein